MQMIPIFHAAGHLLYARCSRLFVQQLDDLKYRFDVSIYNQFVNGLFTVSGNFTDQTIETKLMRLLKTSGGLIHGRGISDSTLSQFVHAMPHTIPICQYLEDITGCSSANTKTYEQPTRREMKKT